MGLDRDAKPADGQPMTTTSESIARASAERPKCPRCGRPIELFCAKVSDSLWFCEDCGMVYPEPAPMAEPPQPDDQPARYDAARPGNVWDGEGQ